VAGAGLRLLRERVGGASAASDEIAVLLDKLGEQSLATLQRIAGDAEIPPAHWKGDGTVAEAAIRLVDVALRTKRLAELRGSLAANTAG
jgi:hypothetical protein